MEKDLDKLERLVEIARRITKIDLEEGDDKDDDLDIVTTILKRVGVCKDKSDEFREEFTEIYKELEKKNILSKQYLFEEFDDLYKFKATVAFYEL